MTSKVQNQLHGFLLEIEKLKTVLRHSWLSNGRRESVAEHTWRMALMAIILSPYLQKKVNISKTLRMILVHDLTEINAPDFVAFKKRPKNKSELERKSLLKLVKTLPKNLQKEITDLWEEYESNKSNEAHFAKALDKMEVLMQHNQSNIKSQTKKELKFNLVHGDTYCNYDPFVKSFRQLLKQETLNYYKRNKVKKEHYVE